jgi:molybdopterin biosynthesis enzyme MoaB
VINLPGSPGGVRDGLDVLDEVLDHLVDQVSGSAQHLAPLHDGSTHEERAHE